MTTSHAAMKKDLDVVEQKFQNYTPINKFMDLQRECTTFALQTEIIRLEGEIYKTNEYQKKFILKTDINERLQKIEKEIWEELATKLRTDKFEMRFNNFEMDMSSVHKTLNQDINNLREVCDRIRKKNEDNVKKINETRAELELKMS